MSQRAVKSNCRFRLIRCSIGGPGHGHACDFVWCPQGHSSVQLWEGDRHRPAVVNQKKSEKRKKRPLFGAGWVLLNLKKGNFLFPVDLVLCLLHKALQEREGRTHIHISLCTSQKHYGMKVIKTHVSALTDCINKSEQWHLLCHRFMYLFI